MASQNTPTPQRATRRARRGASPGPTMLRPFATAGVVLLGAGFVVSAAPSVGHLTGFATVRDVTLIASESDLLTPWIDQYNTASENATKLMNTFFDAPNVGWQQFIANMSGYLQEFFNDPTSTSVTNVMGQIQDNLTAVVTGYALQNATPELVQTVINHTLENIPVPGTVFSHNFVFSDIGLFIPASVNFAEVQPIIDFLASPLSGIIMGELGPEISPWIALSNSMSAGDDLNTTLANMVGAYFNGADLSLNGLIPLIDKAGVFPQGFNIENLDVAFGGLLSPGAVNGGLGQAPGVGGSIFNSLGILLTGLPAQGKLSLTGEPVGPIAAWEAWGQTIASMLGWNGSGSPLSDATLPTIPTDSLDAGAADSTAAADLSGLIQDLLSGLGL